MGLCVPFAPARFVELDIKIAAQCFFCDCKGCTNKLKTHVSVRHRESTKDCKFWPIFQCTEDLGWNDYSVLEFHPVNGYNDKEYDKMTMETVDTIAFVNTKLVKIGGYGAFCGLQRIQVL